MGCEGGSIEGRQEVVKLKAKPERADPDQVNLIRWTLCALSQQPLRPDEVVCDYLGNLYNRDAVVTHLWASKGANDAAAAMPSAWASPRFAHLTSVRDVFEVKLRWNEERKGTGSLQGAVVRYFVCPITNVPGNGRFAFLARPKCGCVFSKKALQELPATGTCLVCNVPAEPLLIPLLPDNPEEVKTLSLNFQKMKAQRRANKLQRNGSAASTAGDEKSSSSSSSSRMDVELSSGGGGGGQDDEKLVQNGKRKSVTTAPTTSTSRATTAITAPHSSSVVSVADRVNGVKKSKLDSVPPSLPSSAAMSLAFASSASSVAREAELAIKARIGANSTYQSLFRGPDAGRTMAFISTKQDIV